MLVISWWFYKLADLHLKCFRESEQGKLCRTVSSVAKQSKLASLGRYEHDAAVASCFHLRNYSTSCKDTPEIVHVHHILKIMHNNTLETTMRLTK